MPYLAEHFLYWLFSPRQEDTSPESLGVARIFEYCYRFLTAVSGRRGEKDVSERWGGGRRGGEKKRREEEERRRGEKKRREAESRRREEERRAAAAGEGGKEVGFDNLAKLPSHFLLQFCKRNITNQKSLYEYMQFMVNQLVTYGNQFRTVEAMCEVSRFTCFHFWLGLILSLYGGS